MIVDAITTVRRRDMLHAVCPDCGEVKLRPFTGDTVYCTVCSFDCPRWATKSEIIDLLYEEGEDELIDDES